MPLQIYMTINYLLLIETFCNYDHSSFYPTYDFYKLNLIFLKMMFVFVTYLTIPCTAAEARDRRRALTDEECFG